MSLWYLIELLRSARARPTRATERGSYSAEAIVWTALAVALAIVIVGVLTVKFTSLAQSIPTK